MSAFFSAILLVGCGSGVKTVVSTPTGVPGLSVSPMTTLTFTGPTGQTSTAQTFTLTNSGSAVLTFKDALVPSGATGDFAQVSPSTCGSIIALAAGNSCTLSFVFMPQAAGTFTETLTGTDNASNSSVSLTLTGTATASAPTLLVSPSTTLTFSATAGQTSAAQSFTLSNTGNATLTLGSFVTAGATTAFTQTSASTCGSAPSLVAGASCTLAFTFSPATAGTFSETLTTTDNASSSNVVLTLNGTGAAIVVGAPVLTVTPSTTLTFASTTVGQTSTAQTFTLTNSGNATLTVSAFAAAGATTSFAESSASTCGATISLAAGGSCTLAYTFSPQTAGTLTETLSATDNTSAPNVVLTLTGTGTALAVPTATLAPSLTFPSTTAGSTAAAQAVTLTNGGTGTLTIGSIALGGPGAADFKIVSSTCSTTLAAGASCQISVSFTPAAASTTYTATLTATDNANNVAGSTQSVSLTGAGAAPTATALAVLSPATLNFPSTNTGVTSASMAITLSNPGSATLTGISMSIGGGTASSAFALANTGTCGTTLIAGASCEIDITFTPSVTGTYQAILSVTDSAANSAQTATLNGTGVAAQAVLSPTTLNFPSTLVGVPSASMTATLSNPGTATLTGISIGAIAGTNPTEFSETPATTCGTTLAAGASCNISATFTPAAVADYTATIAVTTGLSATAQTLTLTGSGTNSAVTHVLYVFPEPDNSVTPLYTFINSAQTKIDMTMYEMQDTTFTNDLIAQCNKGVKVRVIFSSSVASSSATAYSALNAVTNCSAVNSNKAFTNTHQKTITIDGSQTAIMSLNLQTQYYSTTRDFALITNDTADIAAIEATFEQDYAAGGTTSQTEFNYQPGPGTDLIWSPTTAKADMLSIIQNAKSTLSIENEELANSASYIISALSTACQNGVVVHFAIEYDSSYKSGLDTIKAAGCKVVTYNDPNGFYIHAKVVVADYGLATQAVYMGSINYSNASMTSNRELGVYITDTSIASTLNTTLAADFAGGATY